MTILFSGVHQVLCALLLISAFEAKPALGQSAEALEHYSTPSMSDIQRKSLDDLANDIPQLLKYRQANAMLSPTEKGKPRVVFFGDSLTEGWGMAHNGSVFFPGKFNYINRGISGQTTLQMLVRFRQDVIDLHPAVVLILAGTNDIDGNMGPASAHTITDNLQSMVQLAQANGVRPVLCSVLPAAVYRWRPNLNPVETVRLLNQWIRHYAETNHLVYVDYYAAMADGKGGMKDGLAWDGVHPNAVGYRMMAPMAEAAIDEYLRRKP
jgi:lysophospholipase L1-like esterase